MIRFIIWLYEINFAHICLIFKRQLILAFHTALKPQAIIIILNPAINPTFWNRFWTFTEMQCIVFIIVSAFERKKNIKWWKKNTWIKKPIQEKRWQYWDSICPINAIDTANKDVNLGF